MHSTIDQQLVIRPVSFYKAIFQECGWHITYEELYTSIDKAMLVHITSDFRPS